MKQKLKCMSCGLRLSKKQQEECMGLCPNCRRDSLKVIENDNL